MSTDEVALRALINYRAPTPEEIQQGIDAAMREVITRDARHNPQALRPPENVRPAGAPVVVDASKGVNGWVDNSNTKMPPGQDIIERLCNSYLPHGPQSKAK
jgi:hypothetical protein